MPKISAFYGLVIYIYSREHGVPHFHARHGDDEAVIDIAAGTILEGRLPRRHTRLVLEWNELHRDDLLAAWNRARRGEPAGTIDPLP